MLSWTSCTNNKQEKITTTADAVDESFLNNSPVNKFLYQNSDYPIIPS